MNSSFFYLPFTKNRGNNSKEVLFRIKESQSPALD